MIEEGGNSQVGPSSWNLSGFKIELLGKLHIIAVQHNLSGKYSQEYETWKQVETLIRNRLTKPQLKKIHDIKVGIGKKAGRLNPKYVEWKKDYDERFSEKFTGRKRYLNNDLLRIALPKYVDYLQKLLLIHNMDIATEDTTLDDAD